MNTIIGISGKSCSGKNVVGSYLEKKGFEVWDLDRKAEEIREEKKDLIIKAFGTDDKNKIRSMVFSDKNKLKKLENIIYPELEKRIREHKGTLVINGATIRRAGMDRLCNFLIFTDSSYKTRLERAVERDKITEAVFKAREESQTDINPSENKYLCPVFVFNTEGSLDYEKLNLIISEGLDKYAFDRQES
ncbi:MAG: dephospho-CoA kinase [Sphaerochaetaceae bacterium]|nr:dephospho-CoA kinase [Sphaerochaetaceae bacterium]